MRTEIITDVATLQESDVFQSRVELIKFMMLRQIRKCPNGLGAWELPAMLSKEGIEISTATVGRYLKDLDNHNLTRKVGNRGRVLTEEGEKRLTQLELDVESSFIHKSVKGALSGSEYQDLMDIYAVRVVVELEAVKLCCRNATEEDLKKIEEYVAEYEAQAEKGNDFTEVSLDFHVLIAQGTHNHFMEKLLAMLIFEQKKIEYNLEYLVTRSCGKRFSEQHRSIFKSIYQRNEVEAVQLMKDHFNDIINSMNQQLR